MLRKLMVLSAVLAFSIFLPTQVGASTIDFEHDGGGFSYVESSGFFFLDVSPLVGTFPASVDSLTMETGTTLSTTVHGDGAVDYAYDGGTLTFYSSGNPVAVIPILPFGISLSPPIYDPVWGNYPGPVSKMNGGGGQDLSLGPGTLDPALAQALGVHENTLGGTMFYVVDDIAGDVNSPVRQATPNFISGSIEVELVPEPSAVILMILGSAGFAMRRWATARSLRR